MQTDPTARHSPIGSFQRVCYLARAQHSLDPTLASSLACTAMTAATEALIRRRL
jgi:hypothetical protein